MNPASLLLPLVLSAPVPLHDNEYALWDGRAPATVGDPDLNRPLIAEFRPAKGAGGAAVIVIPGGGYEGLALDSEGVQAAQWLNDRGVTAFVLEYRIVLGTARPLPLHPAPLLDVQRAVRVVRYNAKAFGVDPQRIGVWGFSAGGHLASLAATRFDAGNPNSRDAIERVSSRPDFAVMAYPLIFLGKGSNPICQTNLVGTNPGEDLLAFYSSDKLVTPETPPNFLFHTVEDKVVSVDHSRRFKAACDKQGVPSAYLELQQGPHGVAMGTGYPDIPAGQWTAKLDEWLKQQGLYDSAKPKATTGKTAVKPVTATPTP